METLPVRPGAIMTPPDSSAATARPGVAAAAAPTGEGPGGLPPSPLQQAVSAARAEAASRQAGLGVLFADLDKALTSPALPPAFEAAIRQVLAQQLRTDRPITADLLKRAIATSGLFLEAQLALGADAPTDLKAAMLRLRQVLTRADARLPAQLQRPTAPPPLAGQAPTAHPPAPSTLTGAETTGDLLQHLRGDLEQALARQTLHQLASLPDGAGRHWMFELPLATPQGVAIGQFAIDQDEAGSGGQPGEAPGWQARFSLHLAPLGPVHVRLHTDGGRTHVTFWTETTEGLDRLRGGAPDLAAALDAEIVFHAGPPPQAAPPPGQLVDRAS